MLIDVKEHGPRKYELADLIIAKLDEFQLFEKGIFFDFFFFFSVCASFSTQYKLRSDRRFVRSDISLSRSSRSTRAHSSVHFPEARRRCTLQEVRKTIEIDNNITLHYSREC